MGDKALVGNAADDKQVEESGRKEKFQNEIDLEDIRSVLSTKEGRRLLWRVMSKCLMFESFWHPNSEYLHYRSGRYEIGCFIRDQIIKANEEAFLLMMKENKKG